MAQSSVAGATLCMVSVGVTVLFARCGSQSPEEARGTRPASPTSSSTDGGPAPRAFLDEKRTIPAGKEWVRDITSGGGGTFTFRVSSQGPFSVSVLKDDAYRALVGGTGGAINPDDVLLTIDSPEPELEQPLTVGPGATWFIIQNQTDREVELHLQCFAP
jgi:hypothetical protein